MPSNRVRLSQVAAGPLRRIRVSRVAATTQVVGASRRIRVSRVLALSGAAPPPGGIAGTDQTAEPGQTVTLTFSGADTYVVTQTAGTAVTLAGSGNTRSFVAPSVLPPGATLTFHVVGTTVGRSQSDDVTVSVVAEQVWVATAIDGGIVTWTPSKGGMTVAP